MILCEKPVTLSVERIENALRSSRRQKVPLMHRLPPPL